MADRGNYCKSLTLVSVWVCGLYVQVNACYWIFSSSGFPLGIGKDDQASYNTCKSSIWSYNY